MPCPVAPRTAARLRRAVRLGPRAESCNGGGPRPAPAGGRAARRPRRPCRGRSGRRSRLRRRCAATRSCGSTGRTRRCRSIASSRSIRRCRTCTGFMPPARRASCMRSRRPIANAPISTARTCSKAASPPPAPPTPAGSTGRCRRWSRAAGSIPATARRLRSARSRRWWCAARRRCCHGRRRACSRPARTP